VDLVVGVEGRVVEGDVAGDGLDGGAVLSFGAADDGLDGCGVEAVADGVCGAAEVGWEIAAALLEGGVTSTCLGLSVEEVGRLSRGEGGDEEEEERYPRELGTGQRTHYDDELGQMYKGR
jgi:hypothetical protein